MNHRRRSCFGKGSHFFASMAWIILILAMFGCGGGGGSSGGSSGGGTNPPANVPPTASAGADQTVPELSLVTLSGSGSDIEGPIASYAWEQVISGGEPAVILTNPNTASASFTAPAVANPTQLTFRLTVKDGQGAPGADTVVVTVNNAGNLSGFVSATPHGVTNPDIVNLETEGTLDWSYWGDSFNQKFGVTEQIGDWSPKSGSTITPFSYDDNPVGFWWTNGKPTSTLPFPTATAVNSTTSLGFGFGSGTAMEDNEGIFFGIPADTSEKTLKLYLGVTSGKTKLTATLRDGSAPPFEVTLENPLLLAKIWVVTLTFGAPTSTFLDIEYTRVGDVADTGGVLNLSTATLSN